MQGIAREINRDHFLWAVGSFCQLHQTPFDPKLLLQHYPPPYTLANLQQGLYSLGFESQWRAIPVAELTPQHLPCLAVLNIPADVHPDAPAKREKDSREPADSHAGSVDQPADAESNPPARLALIARVDGDKLVYFEAGTDTPQTIAVNDVAAAFEPELLLVKPRQQAAPEDELDREPAKFGFKWFVPEVLRHKTIWRDVLLASLAIQLMALATPLFTQVIIDKVIVHHALNTLLVIGFGLLMFMLFTAAMTWARQYLVLHTGNRIDAVLGSKVFSHLFSLPMRYFEKRPTGTLVARIQGIETIREFITGAAVTLLLDFPFLFIFLAIMFYYSWQLTLIVLGILTAIATISILITPVLRERLNKQFQLGARNQAFVTEYINGMETVKSLQMEPQLRNRYGDYLRTFLSASFNTRKLSNTYNVAANTLEQIQTLAVLGVGAWLVMTTSDFTIGMLIAFQMFASRLSQPVLRMVGLWQEFQQANIAVKRLGDVMDAPIEPYSTAPSRMGSGKGRIAIQHLSFRYGDELPYLYKDLNLDIEAGGCVAIMGPSGSGKSTLAKLLQGFYQPTEGRILIDNCDIRHLSANELRDYFGVVPQETMLFSGTIYDNLIMANPHASFEQVVQAAKMAEIHTTLEQLPRGYQTEIGEHGTGLSGGQKQRMAIARAILKRPRILVFDEATSNLDHHTAEQFAQTINKLKGKVTILFITHHKPKGLMTDEAVILGNREEDVPVENAVKSERETTGC
ncbi:peptidase domain-containing ABC transporter [Thiohalophilus sp.]|uniref:peptidase domain-containing ABC transporter n=1 Tax=Thiohalophilus sp. TaxID=3028392 RepID=UPI002ACD8C9A|nr:peptidase domain-containing ABC transporter [Thiohalophilus sp.]MDZ7805105.1 peptidase domain-containing ABC transporter [Thiohalophilus sp.]